MMKRERFFYFNFVLALYMGIMCYFKLVYADPRPFMITDKIKPIGCYSEYGNPSGHSWASMTFPIVLFLDQFHGKDQTSKSWFAYIISLILGIYWAITIPFTRYLLGVHSLDQIVFGSILGFWTALTCHFIARDNIM
jgi:membrane-associated phospholipid phosphatase